MTVNNVNNPSSSLLGKLNPLNWNGNTIVALTVFASALDWKIGAAFGAVAGSFALCKYFLNKESSSPAATSMPVSQSPQKVITTPLSSPALKMNKEVPSEPPIKLSSPSEQPAIPLTLPPVIPSVKKPDITLPPPAGIQNLNGLPRSSASVLPSGKSGAISTKERIPFVCSKPIGVSNLGVTCYLASLTQAWLLRDPRIEPRLDELRKDNKSEKANTAELIYNYIQEYRNCKTEILPHNVVEKFFRGLLAAGIISDGNKQQAADEIYEKLADFLDIEKIPFEITVSRNGHPYSSDCESGKANCLRLQLPHIQVMRERKIRKDNRIETIPLLEGELTATKYQELINAHFKDETREAGPPKNLISEKVSLGIRKPPEFLTVCLGRAVNDGMTPYKVVGAVHEIGSSMRLPSGERYRLVASIRHDGYVDDGHYTATAERDDGILYRMNDIQVTKIERSEFLEEAAESSLLFYEQVDYEN